MYSLNQKDCAEMGNPHSSSCPECHHSAALQYEKCLFPYIDDSIKRKMLNI